VAIAGKAGKVMGTYDNVGLWIWSFGEDGPGVVQSSNPAVAADGLPRAMDDDDLSISNHSRSISSIATSGDGKLAESACISALVLVWDTATGCVRRTLNKAGFNQLCVADRATVIGSCAGSRRRRNILGLSSGVHSIKNSLSVSSAARDVLIV
jgi:hypothetical protein